MYIDRTRTHAAKARTRTRRAMRRDKSARLFLCIAFPADAPATLFPATSR